VELVISYPHLHSITDNIYCPCDNITSLLNTLQMTKKEIEYPDAPCGFVTMYNYKEPFMPFQDPNSREGYGYEGVLVFDGETDKVQCHFCGQWFHALGNHIKKEHALSASHYKELTGLSQTTALIGEKFRQKLIENGKERFNNLKPGGKKSEETKRKISETLKFVTRQRQNVTGTCPLQLIDRLQKKAKELGRCPTRREISFNDAIRSVYGSFTNACEIAGLTPLKPSQTNRKTMYNKQFFVEKFRTFWIKNKRFPKTKDIELMFGTKYKGIVSRYKTVKDEVQKEILYGEKVFQKTGLLVKYSKYELLDIIREFIKVHGREPSTSDCKRGFLPHASRFYYHFGSLNKAIKQL
jgi:hypothetical protein